MAIEALLRDEGVDALVISLFAIPRFETYTPDFDWLRALCRANRQFALRTGGKPVLFCVEGNEELRRAVAARIESQGFPVYPEVSRAIFALSHLSKYNLAGARHFQSDGHLAHSSKYASIPSGSLSRPVR